MVSTKMMVKLPLELCNWLQMHYNNTCGVDDMEPLHACLKPYLCWMLVCHRSTSRKYADILGVTTSSDVASLVLRWSYVFLVQVTQPQSVPLNCVRVLWDMVGDCNYDYDLLQPPCFENSNHGFELPAIPFHNHLLWDTSYRLIIPGRCGSELKYININHNVEISSILNIPANIHVELMLVLMLLKLFNRS